MEIDAMEIDADVTDAQRKLAELQERMREAGQRAAWRVLAEADARADKEDEPW